MDLASVFYTMTLNPEVKQGFDKKKWAQYTDEDDFDKEGEAKDEEVSAEEEGDNVTESAEDDESGMNLSIYPSSNIATFEENGVLWETYDQMYAKIEPLIVDSGVQESNGTEYYLDENNQVLLYVYYQDGKVNGTHFYEYYENGMVRSVVGTIGTGDSIGVVRTEKDRNGQIMLDAYQGPSTEKMVMHYVVYDYDKNGNLVNENRYEDNVPISKNQYNENGDLLRHIAYGDGVEILRYEYVRDEEGNLLSESDYTDGVLSARHEYERDANGNVIKSIEYNVAFSEEIPYTYSLIETYDSGATKKVLLYQLDEEMFSAAGGVATEDMYILKTETEAYENGFAKSITVYGEEQLKNGMVAYKVVTEIAEDTITSTKTYYDKDGNVILTE